MVTIKIILRSLQQRKGPTLISTLALALSVALLLTMGHIHQGLNNYIKQISSETDLIIGAPTLPAHLVFFSLFRIGEPPPLIPMTLFRDIADHPEVARAIPVTTNETHRGYRVTGTTDTYLSTLKLLSTTTDNTEKDRFENATSALIGSNIAFKHPYKVSDQLTIASGSEPSLQDEYPARFTIQAILSPTGTPIDDEILIPLEGLNKARVNHNNNYHESINYILVKLHNRHALFAMQAALTKLSDNTTVAIPSTELNKLSTYKNMINSSMLAMGLIIGCLALLMIFFNLSAGFAERKDDIALLRMVGASPHQIAGLAMTEPVLQMLTALFVGAILYSLVILQLAQWLPTISRCDLHISDLSWLFALFSLGFTTSCFLAWHVYGTCKKI